MLFPFTTPRGPRHEPAATLDRPRRIAALNDLLECAWRGDWASRPELDPATLIEKARARSGLYDLGSDEIWRRSLEVLTAALEREARLSALGRTIAHGQLVGLLATRLRLQALWQRRPDILALPVAAPVVIVGQMRSGSTRVHRLLACDPRFAHTRFFESWAPLPRSIASGLDDRRLTAWLQLVVARLVNPGFAAIHPTAPGACDEEIGWHCLALHGAAFEAQWRVPPFARHCEETDSRPVYREFRQTLQTVAWLRGERRARPWILKVPQFTQDLPSLLGAFPDARFIFLDRDPVTIVASAASLARNQMAIQSDAIDAEWIGREWLRKVALREGRMRAARKWLDRPCVDLAYADVDRDWRGEMGRVYRTLDLPLTAAVERRMADYLRRAARRRADRHRYSLDEFGLTRRLVEAALADTSAEALREAA